MVMSEAGDRPTQQRHICLTNKGKELLRLDLVKDKGDRPKPIFTQKQ